MYKFFFEDYFFDSLENFFKTMKQYYIGFYSNARLFYVDKIIYEYIKIYQQLQEEILFEIGEKASSGIQ